MNFFRYLPLTVLIVIPSLQAKQFALSFDDAPMRDMARFKGALRTQKLIEVLKKHNAQAVFFVNTSKFPRSAGKSRIQKYVQAGHLIANHTHTHLNFDKTSLSEFKSDFDLADSILRKQRNFRPWFRFPMLRHGNTLEKRDGFRSHLKSKNYKNAYVTLDIQDWFMAKLMNDGLKNGLRVDEEKFCQTYSSMILETSEFYESKAVEILGRSPKHMLLLHENDAAALCLDILLVRMKNAKWKIVSPDAAMKDEIYSIQPNTLFSNNGQIAALYHDQKGEKLYEPWSYPWDGGRLIREEFKKQKVFLKK